MGERSWLPWTRRDLWRRGGLGALLVALGCAWVLVALWFVANGAPSAGGAHPTFVPIQVEEAAPPVRSVPVPSETTVPSAPGA